MPQSKANREQMNEDAGRTMADAAESAQQTIERLESAFGAFWAEAAGGDAQPYLRQFARINMEVLGLMGRRTRAAAELPARLFACQTPQDLWAEQYHFMRHSLDDYQSATGRIMDAMQTTAVHQYQELGAGNARSRRET